MKKIFALVLSIIVLISILGGCQKDSNSNRSKKNSNSSKKSSNTSEQESNSSESNNSSIMLKDILGQEGVYCLHADGTISKGGKLQQTEELGLYYGDEPLVIDRTKGDKLIYIGSMVHLGEHNNNMFEMDWKVDKYYWNGKSVDFFEIEIFDGQNIDGMFTDYLFLALDTEDFLEPLGFKLFKPFRGYDGESYIVSKEKRSYTYGAYEGTEWKEVTEYNDIPFYDYHSNNGECAFKAPVIKGKDGYFTIDLTNISAGMYLNDFDSGKFDEYVFEIK